MERLNLTQPALSAFTIYNVHLKAPQCAINQHKKLTSRFLWYRGNGGTIIKACKMELFYVGLGS